MNNLIERLRDTQLCSGGLDLHQEAADEIEMLENPDCATWMTITDTWLEKNPPDIFTGVSGDPGPVFIVALRKALEALNKEQT